MLIHEICKKCSLTKKAIGYYVEQGLLSPSIQGNGYRSFSDEDANRLKKISVLRNLGLSIADIRTVLSDQTDGTLNNGCRKPQISILRQIADRKNLEIISLQEKQKLLQELAAGYDWEQIHRQLQQLEKKQSILERMINLFPGYYGRYMCLHFAPYLTEPVTTDEQQEAFQTIINFLDNTDFRIPDDLREYLDEIFIHFDSSFMEGFSSQIRTAIQDTEKYILENRKTIEDYMAYKQSDFYKTTPAYRLEKLLHQFTDTSGYNDIFLPAMCRLSKSYREYHEALLKADEIFLREYP